MRTYKHILTNLLTGATKTLDVDPIDYRGMTRLYQRSKTYNGILRTITNPQRFPDVGSEREDRGGYHFILNAYEADGVKAQIQYERQKLNNYTHLYENDYIGIINLDAIDNFTREDEFVEVKMADSSKLAKVLSRDEIDVNIFSLESIDGITVQDFSSPYKEITFTPIDIELECTFTGIFARGFSASNVNYASVEQGTRGTTEINEIGDRIVLSATVDNQTLYENTLEESSEFNLIQLSGYSEHEIDIVLSNQTRQWTYDVYVVCRIRNAVGGIVPGSSSEVNIMSLSGTGNFNTRTDVDYDAFPVTSSDILPGYSYELVLRVDWAHDSGAAGSSITSSINTYITSADSYETTEGEEENQIRGLLAYEFFTRILQLITSETDTSKLLYSDFLGRTDLEFQTYPTNGAGSLLFNTNGFQLRQMTSKAVNADLRNAFMSYDSMNALGMGYDRNNDRFFIEPIEEFYKDEAFPFTISDTTDFKTTLSQDYYWNKALGGYPKIEYEDFQGVSEYNTEIEWSSPITAKTTINIRSRYYGDPIGMELARRLNETRFASKDTKYDNNIYIVATQNNRTRTNLNEGGYSGFKGIENRYNPRFTGRQNLLKHTGLLSAEFWKDTTDEIGFRKSLKDTNITYNYGTTNEFDNITDSEMLTPFIYPEVYEFEGVIPDNFISEIQSDPHRYIPFINKGTTYHGYITSVEINDYTGKAIFKLIRANINR
jgi:hypothetical protein